jgi:RHS repeat-associated protein
VFEDRPTNINGTVMIVDAFDRVIDIGSQAATFFSPDGSFKGAFRGQLARRASFVLPGGGVATFDVCGGGLIEYDHPDHLGSPRLGSSPTRGFLQSMAYAPFGELYASSNASTPGAFTGQSPQTSFDQYNFPFREYGTQGRWASPDPAGLDAVDPTLPQSWNRYAYVANAPLEFVDPLGLFLCGSISVTCGPPSGPGVTGSGGGGGPQCSFDSTGTIRCVVSAPGDRGGNSGAGGGVDWIWWSTFLKEFFLNAPSSGPGSCTAIVWAAVADPLSQVKSTVKDTTKYAGPVANVLSYGGMQTAINLNAMVRAKATDPTLGPLAVTGLTAAASGVTTVVSAATEAVPFVVGGADIFLFSGLAKEISAIKHGQCKP